ncbi:MAG: hypothetical protein VW989_08270, partial [Rhodobiaceae bacterium]
MIMILIIIINFSLAICDEFAFDNHSQTSDTHGNWGIQIMHVATATPKANPKARPSAKEKVRAVVRRAAGRLITRVAAGLTALLIA